MAANAQIVNLAGDPRMVYQWYKSYLKLDPNLYAEGSAGGNSTVTVNANGPDPDGITRQRGLVIRSIMVSLSGSPNANNPVEVTLDDTVHTFHFWVSQPGMNPIMFTPPMQMTPNMPVNCVVTMPGNAISHSQYLNCWLEL
jgi:hypothetical protein